jgi:hypothetical protein
MNMVDDATGDTNCRMGEQETIWAAAGVLRSWIEKHGVPRALYTDWRNVYKREPTERERQQGKAPTTQFGRMCERLEIRIIAANSPQAKGRVERNNGGPSRSPGKEAAAQKGSRITKPRMRICKRIIFLSTTDDLRGKRRDPRTTTCARQVRRGCERFFDSRRNAGSATIGWCSTTAQAAEPAVGTDTEQGIGSVSGSMGQLRCAIGINASSTKIWCCGRAWSRQQGQAAPRAGPATKKQACPEPSVAGRP